MKDAPLTLWSGVAETPLIAWLATLMLILAICTDWPATIENRRSEWALSDRMAQSNRQIAKCLEERGAGAGVVLDEDEFFRDCSIRHGKRSGVLLPRGQQ